MPPGWDVEVDPLGNLLMTHRRGGTLMAAEPARAGLRYRDPILFQVLNSAFASITDEMGALVRRAAFSLVVSEGGDYSGTISDREGNLVASGVTDLAAHLGTIPFTVKGTLDWIGVPAEEYFRPGDVVLVNDPYVGGTHHNDMRAIMPVYLDGRLVAFIQNSMHWTDIGGHVPGTFDPNARASYGEGLAVPPVHIVREGVFVGEMADIILRNIRLAEQARGRPADDDRRGAPRRAADAGAGRALRRRTRSCRRWPSSSTTPSSCSARSSGSCPMAPGTSRRSWTATRAPTRTSRSRRG